MKKRELAESQKRLERVTKSAAADADGWGGFFRLSWLSATGRMPSPQYRNPPTMAVSLQHPVLQRRQMLQAGGIALLGLGLSHLEGLRAAAPGGARGRQRSAIFVFLSGGLGQHDSFDMKPNAPENIRGEFKPIATRTPGVQICEHLPRLAARSTGRWCARSPTAPTTTPPLT